METMISLGHEKRSLRPMRRAGNLSPHAQRARKGTKLFHFRDNITAGRSPFNSLEKLTSLHVAMLISMKNIALTGKNPT